VNNLQKGDLDDRVTLLTEARPAGLKPKGLLEAYGWGPAHSSSRKLAMENPSEKQVVRRAYELGEKTGKPDGRDEEFYHLAEQELRDANKSSPLRTPDNL
jgi:Protein of unknown function (DUF2934)